MTTISHKSNLEAIIDDYKTLVANGIKAVRELGQENAQLKSELMEQARLNGMGGERELRLMAENEKLKQMYALLASAWFYGGWKAETHNERQMQKLMEEAGYWPTTEDEIVARAALGEK